jgi:2-oxoglutarate ferredoxin oxidoreductase subunit gamma
VLIIAFQEAYDKYKQPRAAGCTLITEENLIKLDEKDEGTAWTIPALEWAKEMGEERVFNMIMMGFATAITKVVTPEAMRTAIRNLGKMTELNLAAFERGYEYGLAERAKHGQ